MKHNPKVIEAFFKSYGIPKPEFEFRFHPERKWRFDMAWPDLFEFGDCQHTKDVALEIQGGIWIAGRHSRGASLLKEWEKLNEAAVLGWRIIYCQPSDLLKKEMAETIKRALGL